MKKILILAISFIATVALHAAGESEKYSFTNEVVYTIGGNGTLYRLVSMLPVPQTNEYQEITNVTYNMGEIVQEKRYGNSVLVVDKTYPEKELVVSTTFDVQTKSVWMDLSQITEIHDYDPTSEPCRLYLGDRGNYIVTSHPYIVQTGDELWSQSSDLLDYARRCYEYVAQNFTYINGSWRTLQQILNEGGGECGDFSTVVVNLLRYKGIPSRHNMCVLLDGSGYHVWVDFYLEGYGWIPLDATFKNGNPWGDYFGYYDGRCIIMTRDCCYDIMDGLSVDILQSFVYWYWMYGGAVSLSGEHRHINNGLADIDVPCDEVASEGKAYNLQGMEVSADYKGMVIVNGKKYLRK